jgi:hypothetical protein
MHQVTQIAKPVPESLQVSAGTSEAQTESQRFSRESAVTMRRSHEEN